MAAPTHVQTVPTARDTNTATKDAGSFNVNTGDVLVLWYEEEGTGNGAITPAKQAGTATIGTVTEGPVAPTGGGSFARVRLWSCTVTGGGTLTIRFTRASGSGNWGAGVVQWDDSDGVGVSFGYTDNTPTAGQDLAGVSDNSALAGFASDWDAATAGGSWEESDAGTFTQTAGISGGASSFYRGYHADAGAAGTKTVGKIGPTSSNIACAFIEVLGSEDSGTPHEQPVDDTIAGTDARAKTIGKAQADTASVTDQNTRTTAFVRQIADTIAGTDAASKNAGKTQADPASATDASTRAVTHPVTDALSGSDTQARTVKHPVDDTATLADDIDTGGSTAHTHEIDDTIGGTDTVAKASSRPLVDTGSLTDTSSRAATHTVADSVEGSDSRAAAVTHPAADAAVVTDDTSTSSSGAHTRTINDTIGTTDEVTRQWDAVRALADTGALDDTVNTGGSTAHTLEIDDTIQGTDTLTKQAARVTADNISATDQIVKAPAKTLTDTAAGTDLLNRAWAAQRTQADTATLADDILIGLAGGHALRLTGELQRALTLTAALEHTLTLDAQLEQALALTTTGT